MGSLSSTYRNDKCLKSKEFVMSDGLEGSKILDLLAGLDTVPPIEARTLIEGAYDRRHKSPQTAIGYCQRALTTLEAKPSGIYSDLEGLARTKGKCYLLLASIHLDQTAVGNFEGANKYFNKSQEIFHYWGWKHLESLAYLGGAMAQRKLSDFIKAMRACEDARDCLKYESIPGDIDVSPLRQAIESEILIIEPSLPGESLEEEKPPTEPPTKPAEEPPIADEATTPSLLPEEKILPIFRASAGRGLVTTGDITNLNLISRKDYEQSTQRKIEEAVFDLKKRPYAKNADYILEIDKNIKANDGLEPGDWLLIRTENTLNELKGRKVAVLLEDEDGLSINSRTYVQAEDHYFLKAPDQNIPSIIVVNYKTSVERIREIDALHYEKKIFKRIDDIQVSGIIINNKPIRKKVKKDRVERCIWQIPIVNEIAAGLDCPVMEENIEGYTEIRKKVPREDEYFVTVVKGDSMTGDSIFSEDKVLIQQDVGVEKGEIAAVIIKTPNESPVGLLKHYYLMNEKSDDLRHWLLKSSNPSSKHLVVIPDISNAATIKKNYQKLPGQKYEFYENAEVKIAGKYIKVVEKASDSTSSKDL